MGKAEARKGRTRSKIILLCEAGGFQGRGGKITQHSRLQAPPAKGPAPRDGTGGPDAAWSPPGPSSPRPPSPRPGPHAPRGSISHPAQRTSPAGLEPVPSELRTPRHAPGRSKGGRRRRGGGETRGERKGRPEKQRLVVWGLGANSHDSARCSAPRPSSDSDSRSSGGGVSRAQARREAHRSVPPSPDTFFSFLFLRDRRSPVPNYGCPDESIRARDRLLFPSPSRGGAPGS